MSNMNPPKSTIQFGLVVAPGMLDKKSEESTEGGSWVADLILVSAPTSQ